MLRSFRLENHRSFRDEAELSFLSAYGSDRMAVPVAAVYGANAAGKSNLLHGLRFMTNAVRDSYRRWDPDGGVPRAPFRLGGPARTNPSTYVVELLIDGVKYVYGLVVDDDVVCDEWLYSYPKGKRRKLFSRGQDGIELGESLSAPRALTDVLTELIRPNSLFLSLAAQLRIPELTPVHHWFVGGGIQWSDDVSRAGTASSANDRSKASVIRRVESRSGMMRVFSQGPIISILADSSDENSDRRDRFLALLLSADVGIQDVILEEDRNGQNELLVAYQERISIAQDVLDRAEESGDQERIARALRERNFALSRFERVVRDGQRLTVKFNHGGAELFDVSDESMGTLAWLSLLPTALSVLSEGGLLVVDEIDSSLHPNLTALLIKQFRSPNVNEHGAQLLFTTHDATLLGTAFGEEVLGRDEVWFVEKESDGASRLYPLTDFHPRTGENRERRYLGGSYGGVPVVGDPALRARELTERL